MVAVMYTSNSGIAGAVVLITGGLGAISLTYAKQLMSHGIKVRCISLSVTL